MLKTATTNISQPHRIQQAACRNRRHSRLCCAAVQPCGGEQQLGGDGLRADPDLSSGNALATAVGGQPCSASRRVMALWLQCSAPSTTKQAMASCCWARTLWASVAPPVLSSTAPNSTPTHLQYRSASSIWAAHSGSRSAMCTNRVGGYGWPPLRRSSAGLAGTICAMMPCIHEEPPLLMSRACLQEERSHPVPVHNACNMHH